MISPVFFFLFAGMAIAFSLSVILKRNPVSSAFSLVMVFFSFAGIYAVLSAHLIAALQVLVYAGAIMVLFVFVIMLLNADAPSLDVIRTSRAMKVVGGLVVFVLWIGSVLLIKNSAQPTAIGIFTPEKIQSLGGNTKAISQLMFTEYLLPFELTSVLLLAAIVGAVAIAKRKLNKKEGGSK